MHHRKRLSEVSKNREVDDFITLHTHENMHEDAIPIIAITVIDAAATAYLDVGLGIFLHHLEGEVLDVCLDVLVRPVAANQTLGVENCVLGIGGQLVLGRISYQSEESSKISPKYAGDELALYNNGVHCKLPPPPSGQRGGVQCKPPPAP